MIVGGVMKQYKWMKLEDVKKSLSAMDARDVSRVARGLDDSTQTKEGFVEAYIAVKGDQNKMMTRKTGRLREGQEKETWAERRSQFIARHLKEMRDIDTHRNGWQPNGQPTRRHLGLMAWAYTPSPKRTEKWIKTQKKTNWREFVGKIKNPKKSIKAAIHRLSTTGVHEKIGFVTFSDSDRGLKIDVDVRKLPDGEHGFHVHEFGNLAPKIKEGKMVAGLSAGQHYDPLDAGFHGSPTGHGHLGDLPFITVKNGVSHETIYAPRLLLADIENRAIIIHKFGDNYSDFPLPNGGGKSRIAGGILTNSCPYCVNKNPKFSVKKLENLLDKVYDRGFAAWASGGHRPNQTPQSWANARINSFLVGGKTFFTGDQDLAREIKNQSPKLYQAILNQRTYEPSKPIPSSKRRVIRDSKGRKIPAKYLSGFRGKEKAKRIKEIEKRRDEYASALKRYGDEKNFPQKVMEKLYAAWSTDKGKSLIKSPYTKEAHKRGFRGSKKEKAQAALDYYLKGVKPQENPPDDMIEGEIVSVLKDGVWIPTKNPWQPMFAGDKQSFKKYYRSYRVGYDIDGIHPSEDFDIDHPKEALEYFLNEAQEHDDAYISFMEYEAISDHEGGYELLEFGYEDDSELELDVTEPLPAYAGLRKTPKALSKKWDSARKALKKEIASYVKLKDLRKDKDIINALVERFKGLSIQPLPEVKDIKWRKGKDFDMYGEWETEINGKIYEIFRDTFQFSYPVWYLGRKSAKDLKYDRNIGYNRKKATESLLELIREDQK